MQTSPRLCPRLFAPSSLAFTPLALTVLVGLSMLALSGCSYTPAFQDVGTSGQSMAIQGLVHGGQQPVSQSHVHLMEASPGGYGGAATSLLNGDVTGFSDTIGGYVETQDNGTFQITAADYTCTQGQIVYALATQGNPGLPLGSNNSALAMLSVLGVCPAAQNFLTATPVVDINELTTVAGVYALAGFMTDDVHLAYSGTSLATTGITNAAANAGYMVPLGTGSVLSKTPNGLGTVPLTVINTLADILSTCVNSDGTTPCTNLFNLTPNGDTTPTDTVTAALNIAHNPATSVDSIYGLLGGTAVPFQPDLGTAPHDWSLSITYSVIAKGAFNGTGAKVAFDKSGNLWLPDSASNLIELSPAGAVLTTTAGESQPYISISPTNGDIAGAGTGIFDSLGLLSDSGAAWAATEQSVAFDSTGNAWAGNANPASIGEISLATGKPVNDTGYTTGGLSLFTGNGFGLSSIAVDNQGFIWATCPNCSNIIEIDASGNGKSPATTGYGTTTLLAPSYIAIDASNNAWVLDSTFSGLDEFDDNGNLVAEFPPFESISAGSDLSIDGSNTIWVAGSGLYEITPAAHIISPSGGFKLPSSGENLAIDGSGNVWVTESGAKTGVVEYIGIATPVVTPITPGALGTEP
jgi:hypothetical protein